MNISQTARLTSKCQTTIPKRIREVLGVGAGDSVIFIVEEEDRVVVRAAPPLDVAYLAGVESTLEEWASPEDDEAFGDL